MPKDAKALTAKQQRFVAEYLKDLNATQAVIRAGYKATSATTTGPRMLENVGIRRAIDEAQSKLSTKSGVTLDWIIERYKRIADADIRKFYDANGNLKPIHELDDASATALAGVETDEEYSGGVVVGRVRKIKRWDPVKALDSLGRHLGMFAADNKPITLSVSLEVLVNASKEPVTIEHDP